MESSVDFVAADNPYASKFNIHILAAVAELEREMISTRTREALQEAKRRGVKLGSARPGHWTGREDHRRAGSWLGGQRAAAVHRERADRAYGDVAPRIQELHRQGASLRQIAAQLNDEGIPTRRGAAWHPSTVRALLQRRALDRGRHNTDNPSKGLATP